MNNRPAPRSAQIPTLTAMEAHRAIQSGAVLVDVREPDEWRAGHATAALHLPLAQLSRHVADLPADREIIVICRSGRRSASAAVLLTGLGLHASNLTGGMTAWTAAGLPIVTDPGRLGPSADTIDVPPACDDHQHSSSW